MRNPPPTSFGAAPPERRKQKVPVPSRGARPPTNPSFDTGGYEAKKQWASAAGYGAESPKKVAAKRTLERLRRGR